MIVMFVLFIFVHRITLLNALLECFSNILLFYLRFNGVLSFSVNIKRMQK